MSGSPIERMDNRQRLALYDFLEYLKGLDPSKLDDETCNVLPGNGLATR